jgi:hypothetical protein
MRKKPYLCRDMRYLVVTALALLSWSWAQQYVNPRQTRVFKRNPQIEAITRDAQWVRINLDEGLSPGTQPQRRITSTDFGASLGWLLPSQDADTVPTTINTLPDFAGDTLLANGAGEDIDPNISSDCNHSFFDSLYIKFAWVVRSRNALIPFFGNYLHGNPQRDTVFYLGGGIAERYDIIPPTGSSVYIKGIATQILNNFNLFRQTNTPQCNTSTGEVSLPQWQDGAYTIAYQLLDTIHIIYDVRVNENDPPDLREGSYPDQVVAEVTKPLTDVRIGYVGGGGQCVTPVISGGRNRLERLDYAYFPTPVEITNDPNCKKSFYAAIRYELYVPGGDVINDTLFGLIGPAYRGPDDDDPDPSPCFTGDTVNPGRNMVLTPVFRQSTSEFIYPDEWYPQYFAFAGRGYDLNFLLFPIIYVDQTAGNCLTTSTPVVRNGSMAFSAPYPNPAVDCLHLNVESPAATTLRLTLYTSEGRLVRSWNRPLQSGTNTVAVDLEVPAGAYLLQAQSPYGTATFWVNVVK